MKKSVVTKSLIIIAAVIINTSAALADRREITFPDGVFVTGVSPHNLGFAFDDEVGLVVTIQNATSFHLNSFLVKEGKPVDDIDLTSEFGVIPGNHNILPFAFIKVHSATGLVIVYGVAADESQKVIACVSDRQGHLRLLWKISFPKSFIPLSALSFKEDGSRICLLYRDSAVHALLLNSEDGAILSRVNIPVTGITPILRPPDFVDTSFSAWIDFDEKHGRVVAVAGDSAYLLGSGNDALALETKISAASLGARDLFKQALSRDGRFVIAEGGYRLYKNAKKNEFIFFSFDLEAKTAREFLIRSKYSPSSNPAAFHAPSGNLFMPLSVAFKLIKKRVDIIRSTSRYALILNLTSEGELLKTVDVTIPEQSGRSNSPNVVGEFSSIEVTAGGALALLPSTNGRLFAFDTSTGEIVNDVDVNSVNGGLLTTRLLESSGVILFSIGRGFVLFDVQLAPFLTSIEISKNRTRIIGANFLSGVRVEIDGKDVEGVSRDSADPGFVIELKRGRDDFPTGQEITLVVVNRDNTRSRPFKFRF